MLETPIDFNETAIRGKRVYEPHDYKYVMAPQGHCHVCGGLLEHSFPLKRERCGNEACQVHGIWFNMMMATVEGGS